MTKKTCFVIMPFGQTTTEHNEEYWTNHFEKFLKLIIEENKELEAHRSEPMRGDVLRNIIFNLVQNPIVVADLTDNNPNVYWELGVRQSFKQGTITIAEEGIKLPFDVSVKGTLFYSPTSHTKMEEFRRTFKKTLEDCLIHPNDSDSHVLESMSGRGSLFEIFRRDETIRRLDSLLEELNHNLKLLDHVVGQCEENLKGGKRTYHLRKCQRDSVTVLLSNRYLDQDCDFYEIIRKCLEAIDVINSQIEIWEFKSESVEKYLIDSKDLHKRIINAAIEKIQEIRSNMIDQI
jgi:hypothetical protein